MLRNAPRATSNTKGKRKCRKAQNLAKKILPEDNAIHVTDTIPLKTIDSIICLYVRVGSEYVTQNASCRSKPRTPALAEDNTKHVPSTSDRYLQFCCYTLANDANSILILSQLLELIA